MILAVPGMAGLEVIGYTGCPVSLRVRMCFDIVRVARQRKVELLTTFFLVT